MYRVRLSRRLACLFALATQPALMPLRAQLTAPTRAGEPAPQSAEIDNLRYDVTFDRASAAMRTMTVATTFDVVGSGAVLLSLPEWTPGAYEISGFARWVTDFRATAEADGSTRDLQWDKLDYDTWRVQPAGAKTITLRFTYVADTLDNAMAWSRRDFLLFNGTNVFLYPEGRSLSFSGQVTVHTDPTWRVVARSSSAGVFLPSSG